MIENSIIREKPVPKIYIERCWNIKKCAWSENKFQKQHLKQVFIVNVQKNKIWIINAEHECIN